MHYKIWSFCLPILERQESNLTKLFYRGGQNKRTSSRSLLLLRKLSWQGWQAGNQTFSDEELEKVDVQEIRELFDFNCRSCDSISSVSPKKCCADEASHDGQPTHGIGDCKEIITFEGD